MKEQSDMIIVFKMVKEVYRINRAIYLGLDQLGDMKLIKEKNA